MTDIGFNKIVFSTCKTLTLHIHHHNAHDLDSAWSYIIDKKKFNLPFVMYYKYSYQSRGGESRCCACHWIIFYFHMSCYVSETPRHEFSLRWALLIHDDVIKWKHFPRYWPMCGEVPGQWWISLTKTSDVELLMFSLIWAWINGSVNNRETGDLRRNCAHYDVIVMICQPALAITMVADVLCQIA